MSEHSLNILHVLSDQHLAACMGVAGHPQAITPNMDRLAAEGVLFRNAYAQNTICTPNRVTMLSGQYCHNHGYYGLSGPRPANLPSYLSHFRAHGYRTAAIGKLHTPDDPNDWLADHTDELLEVYARGSAGYDGKPGTNEYLDYLDSKGLRDREDSAGWPELPGMQQLDGRPSLLDFVDSVEGWCVQRAVRFMDAARAEGKPFCMQVSLPRPHQCFTPDRRFWDLYPDDLELPETLYDDASHRPPIFRQMVAAHQKFGGVIEPKGFEEVARRIWRGYLACITQVDHALGLLMDAVDERDTIVMYGSDHGGYSGTFGLFEKAPGISSEAVCRVPAIWRGPSIAREHVSDAFVEHVDLAPTFAALAGLPAMATVDGKDIRALLSGEDAPVRDVAVTENPWSKALRWRNWRFVHYQPEMFGGQDVAELYDLDADPDERENLYHDLSCAGVVATCRRLLLEWLIRTTRVVTSWPSPSDPFGWPVDYATAADGKQATGRGPEHLVQERKNLNYL